MTDPKAHDSTSTLLKTIDALQKIDRDAIGYHGSLARSDAILHLAAIASYEVAARCINSGDPDVAYRMLRDMDDCFPEVRKALMAAAFEDVKARAPAELPGGRIDQYRQEAFKRSPGSFPRGATRADVSIHPAGIFFVHVDGVLCPWTYCNRMWARSDAEELSAYMEQQGFERGFLVGEVGSDRGLKLRPGVQYVAVDLDREAA